MSTPGDRRISADERLVAAALRGDKEAFGSLVQRYWPTATALAMARTGNAAHAEDIAQSSFLRAYEQLHTLRDHTRFAGWLSKLVLQQCADHARRQARERSAPLSAIHEGAQAPLAAAGVNPGLTESQRQLVRNTVCDLPEKYRTVIILRFVSGLSTLEIAHQLGKRSGTVRVWLHRAYQRLRRDLSPLVQEAMEP